MLETCLLYGDNGHVDAIYWSYPIVVEGRQKLCDMGMTFRYPRISISGPTHYKSGQAQGLEDDLKMKKEGSNPYSTRTLVKP
jgi:hypothetical protein